MAGDPRKPTQGLQRPGDTGPRAALRGPSSASFGGYKKQNAQDFAKHAQEIKSVASGQDVVERPPSEIEKRPAQFDREELQVVRSWVRGRPLEPTAPAAALVAYPRLWTTKRGRYAKFRIPGSGTYGLVRARPTF